MLQDLSKLKNLSSGIKKAVRAVLIERQIKASFLATNREVPIKVNGQDFYLKQIKIDKVWYGILSNENSEETILTKEQVLDLISKDESIKNNDIIKRLGIEI